MCGQSLAFLISTLSSIIPKYLRRKYNISVEYCINVLINKCAISLIIFNWLFRQHRSPVMAGINLGRSLSLHDVSGSHQPQPSSSSLSTSVADVRVQFGAGIKNATRTRSTATVASEEEGLALLGEDDLLEQSAATADNSLLDYDSDGPDPSHHAGSGTSVHLVSTAMETDSEPATKVAPELDAMYYQSRSARLAGRQDTFVSLSNDNSFGKIVTVQSPQIGSFEDHCNLQDMFHGS
jgi:hypothetical protein